MAQKFKYNGKELEEAHGLNWYEMDVRQYDPAMARFTSIDPVTHHSMSTYTAFDNNPVYWADPSGADATAYIADIWNRSSDDGYAYTYSGTGSLTAVTKPNFDDGDEWIPKVDKKTGEITYIKENGDSDKTLASQFGLSLDDAQQIIANAEDKDRLTGDDVAAVTGSKILKLNMFSALANDQRIFNQILFAIDFSRALGINAFTPNVYFDPYKFGSSGWSGVGAIRGGEVFMDIDGVSTRVTGFSIMTQYNWAIDTGDSEAFPTVKDLEGRSTNNIIFTRQNSNWPILRITTETSNVYKVKRRLESQNKAAPTIIKQ